MGVGRSLPAGRRLYESWLFSAHYDQYTSGPENLTILFYIYIYTCCCSVCGIKLLKHDIWEFKVDQESFAVHIVSGYTFINHSV